MVGNGGGSGGCCYVDDDDDNVFLSSWHDLYLLSSLSPSAYFDLCPS